LGKNRGFSSDDILEVFLWVIPLGVVFARIAFLIAMSDNPDTGFFPVTSWGFKEYFETRNAPNNSFINLIAIWEGGITIIGGLIGGALGILIFVKRKKIKVAALADIGFPVVLLCQAIGRWGNFFNQECYGFEITNPAWQWFPFAVYIDRMEGYFAATFFYAFIINLTGAVVIYLLCKKSKVEGLSFFMYPAWYCTKRFFMEFIREDAFVTQGGVHVTQILVGIVALISIALGVFYYIRGLKKLEHKAVSDEVRLYIDSRK
jgi:prolipoprotein diacylglyceryl transferase